MREPGRLILRLTHVLGLTRLRETVVLPAIADLRHECGKAGPGLERALVLARGYWSVLAGAVFYGALLPSRHLRENWTSLSAPGPRLLRGAAPVTMLVIVLTMGIIATDLSEEQWSLGVGILALLVPLNLVQVAPLALATGVGWSLARDRSSSGAALVVGLLGTGLIFTFYDRVVPDTNQAYREASYHAKTGKSVFLRRGDREMTLSELGAATTLSTAVCIDRMSRCTDLYGAIPARLQNEWHKRLSLPAFCFSLVALAAALSQSGRRIVVVPVLWLANGVAVHLFRYGERYGLSGEIPMAFAIWCIHLVPLTLAAIVHVASRGREPAAV
jgi:hypothetical protein